jgi:hypothetical protein
VRMIDSVAARLDQSVRIVNSLGIDLPASGLAAEHQIRNAIWRCILCSHGAECREWIQSARPGVPEGGLDLIANNSLTLEGSLGSERDRGRTLSSGQKNQYCIQKERKIRGLANQ